MNISQSPRKFQPDLAHTSIADEIVVDVLPIATYIGEMEAPTRLALSTGAIPCVEFDGTFAASKTVLDVVKRQIQAMRETSHLPGGPRGYASVVGFAR